VTVDRFAIPANLYSNDDVSDWVETGLYLYEIGNTDDPERATLNSRGGMVVDRPSAERTWPDGSRFRSILDGDAVYFIKNEEVYGALWDLPDNVLGPQE